MKKKFSQSCASRLLLAVGAVALLAAARLPAQTNAAVLDPPKILRLMERVGDWQLAHAATNRPTGWIQAVGDIGVMALAEISPDPKYLDAMLAKGEAEHWELPSYHGRKYHADDQAYGQVCAACYLLRHDPRMIAPMRAKFDWILAHPPADASLNRRHGEEQWSWCDALFMAPPSWLALAAATHDDRYRDFAVSNFWRTTDFLYDPNAHLFFRDSTFFDQREPNGQKIFWSRGNGWVLAGLARGLEFLPANDPGRPRFEKLFREMAEAVRACQPADGRWRASLLDPDAYPMPEASGTALFTYGLAWGVNHGLLDRQEYAPVILRAWQGLTRCVDADGQVTHVQPAGDRPVQFDADSSQPYGGGVFLLAGCEVYKMAERQK